MALDLAKEIGFKGEWHFCPGGGWGVAYHEDELPNPSVESYVRGIAESVIEGCQQRGLDLRICISSRDEVSSRRRGGDLSCRRGETARREDLAAYRWRHGR